MKKNLFFLIILLLSVNQVYAHPPSKIEAAFDSTTKMLTAEIFHPVKNTFNHHILKVVVSLNGKKILEHKIGMQDDKKSQSVSYRIGEAKSGDELSIEAYCNINGVKSERIILE